MKQLTKQSSEAEIKAYFCAVFIFLLYSQFTSTFQCNKKQITFSPRQHG